MRPLTPPQGYGPADLASAYNINTSLNPGATIAIVDAFGYKTAESDLATYRSQYGLPPCTTASGCLTIVNQDGQTSPLPPEPTANDDWTGETALDLDMASAGCPHCKLLLIQATDDQSDGLFIANNTAAALGATVVSDSWGGPESQTTPDGGSVLPYESYFDHPGVGYFVASGDQGYDNGGAGPDYPSCSAFVTGVGGTSLSQDSSTRGWSETAWSSGGSSCSATIAKPSWQSNANTSCTFRAASDVAAVGDPNTGVAVYDTDNGNTGWAVIGGTSAASPLVAAIYAANGIGSVGPSFAYSNSSAFYDVTSGSNGSCGNVLCNAGVGWDGPTGAGTPNGSALKPPSDFSVALSPSQATASAGGTSHFTLSTTQTSGTGTIAITPSVTGLPSGITAQSSPATANAGQSFDLALSVAAGTAPGTYPFTAVAQGPFTSHTASGTLTVVLGPSISFTSPANGDTLKGIVNVSVQASGVSSSATLSVTLDGQAFGTAQGTAFNQVWDTSQVANGSHVLLATVTDGTQTATGQVSVTINNPIAVAITSPQEGGKLTGKAASIVATATLSGVTLSSIEIDLDDLPWATGSSSPFTATVDTTQLGTGTHTVSARATDSAGDVATSAVIHVSISNTPAPAPTPTPAPSPTPPQKSGCGCDGTAAAAWWWALLPALAFLARRRLAGI